MTPTARERDTGAARVWLRLGLLQASWNFELMQGLGWFYALLPVLRRPADGALTPAARNLFGYFNTQPFLAPVIAGTVVHLLRREDPEGVAARQFADTVMAPYAALGDAFFWGGLRPLASVLSLCLALSGVLWSPLVLLLVLGVPRLWLSLAGFRRGLRGGMASLTWLQGLRLPDQAVRLKQATFVLLGGATALLAENRWDEAAAGAAWLAPPVVLAVAWSLRRGVPLSVMLALGVALATGGALAGPLLGFELDF